MPKDKKKRNKRQKTATRVAGKPNTGVVRKTRIKRAPAGGLVITKKSRQ